MHMYREGHSFTSRIYTTNKLLWRKLLSNRAKWVFWLFLAVYLSVCPPKIRASQRGPLLPPPCLPLLAPLFSLPSPSPIFPLIPPSPLSSSSLDSTASDNLTYYISISNTTEGEGEEQIAVDLMNSPKNREQILIYSAFPIHERDRSIVFHAISFTTLQL